VFATVAQIYQLILILEKKSSIIFTILAAKIFTDSIYLIYRFFHKKEAVSEIIFVTLSGVEMFSDILKKASTPLLPDIKW